MKKLSFEIGVLLGIAATMVLPKWAMSAEAGAGRDLLEEIIVTAQKREQNLQEVPIAVTALSDNFLSDHKIESIQDMAGVVPGLVVTNSVGNGNAPISIRGIGGPNGGGSVFNDEPVGMYVDGVYLARAGGSIQDLVDVDSIQVLRGPQGTLYGRNSTAGAVLVTSKRPTSTFQTAVTGGYDSINLLKLTGMVSGGITNSLSARLAVGYSDGGHFATNIVDGKKVGGAENKTVRASLRYAPSADLTVDVIASHADNTTLPALYAVATVGGTSPGYIGNSFVFRPNFQQAIESDRVALNDVTESKLKSTDGTVLVNWDLGSMSLYSITGYRKLINDGRSDADAQPNTPDYADATNALASSSTIASSRTLANGWTGLLRNSNNQDHKQWSEELRLQSNGNSRIEWTAGLYYLHEDNMFNARIESFQARVPTVPPPPAQAPNDGGATPRGTQQNFFATQKVDAYAVFGDVNFKLTDKWLFTVGARYSDEKKTVHIVQTPYDLRDGVIWPSTACGNPSGVLCISTLDAAKSFSNFSPRAVINYKPTEDMLTYFNFSKGFKSGGYNSFDASLSASAFPEERINAYELGLKADFAQKRIRTNVSAFRYDYTNVQLRQAVFTGGVSIRTVPKAVVKGVELETTFALSRALTVNANVSWLDAKLKQGTLGSILSNLGGLPSLTFGGSLAGPAAVAIGTEDVAGHHMSRAPEWQGALNVEYKTSLTSGLDSRVGVTWRAQSKVYFSETNQDRDTFAGEGWREIDVRAALSDPDRIWEVALLGANVFDNRHVTQVTVFSGFPVAAVNAPARVGLQFSHKMK